MTTTYLSNLASDVCRELLAFPRTCGLSKSPPQKKTMSNENNKRYMAVKAPEGFSNPSIVVIETQPQVRKAVTRKYSDGRVLSLDVVGEKIVEKMMSYKIPFVYEDLKKEKEEGAKVSFKYWVKNGLEVNLTYFGTIVVGKMFVLSTADLVDKSIIPDEWHDELESDVAFPIVNIRSLKMSEGYSAEEKENEHMRVVMEEEILHFLANGEANKKGVVAEEEDTDAGTNDAGTDIVVCEFCAETPCVWTTERENVIAVINADHGDDTSVSNSSRRKSSFRYIWRVRNGVGTKGCRTRHPECVETGVRALFPDNAFMGFKEE
jgi:hypothetical protein